MKKTTIAAIIITLFAYTGSKHLVDQRMTARKLDVDIRYLPSPKILNLISIGYKPAFADMFWIEALNYFGAQLSSKTRTYQYLSSYIDLILPLDPLFTMFYEWAATVFIYNALPITKESVSKSTTYANIGIQNLAKEGRYSFNVISKAAFNYALEAQDYKNSIPYFEMAGRVFPDRRDMLLIGATYASNAGEDQISAEMKMEYLGFIAFEAQQKEQLIYAMQIITSNRFNKDAGNIVKSFRLNMEKDEDIKKIVEQRLNTNPVFRQESAKNFEFSDNPRLQKILNVDFQRNWLPPDLHLLLSL